MDAKLVNHSHPGRTNMVLFDASTLTYLESCGEFAGTIEIGTILIRRMTGDVVLIATPGDASLPDYIHSSPDLDCLPVRVLEAGEQFTVRITS